MYWQCIQLGILVVEQASLLQKKNRIFEASTMSCEKLT